MPPTATDQAILDVDALRKSFGGLVAVDDVSFRVRKGQILGIIGPNGSGKTTLFNLISGFLTPDGGRVTLKGSDITGHQSYRVVGEGLARTFQLARPLTHMTVQETLELASTGPRAKRAVARQGRDAYVAEIAEELGLGRHLHRVTEELNMGELRLTDIGRAMATNPDVLLLDEPFSSLSHAEVDLVSQAISDLLDKGLTVVMVEHKLHALMKLVGDVMVLNFGRKIASGRPSEIVNDTEVIEAYLGTHADRLFNGAS